jgi:hypothetical protein
MLQRWYKILEYGKPTETGRTYPQKEVDNFLTEFFFAHKESQSMLGCMGFPPDGKMRLTDISHVVTDMRIIHETRTTGYLEAEIKTLETTMGKYLEQVLQFGPPYRFTVFCHATVDNMIVSNSILKSVIAIPQEGCYEP